MIEVNCINCGRPQRKRKRDDNGFNFCSVKCKEEGWFKYGYNAKNPYFIIGNLAFVITKNKYNEANGVFIIDKFNIWILNLGSWGINHGYIVNFTVGTLHRFLNNTPEGVETDHINKIKHWNTLKNLRDADRILNNQNKNLRKDNRSSVVGVSYSERDNYWTANISYNKENINLGIFDNPKDTIMARINAENKYWGYSISKFDENIDYLKLFLNNNGSDKSKKDFVGISPNRKAFIYNNQREFSDLFNLDKKLVNITLKKRQNSHRNWKFMYLEEYKGKVYKDLRKFSYCIGLDFNKTYPTKNCGDIEIISKFNSDKEIAVIFKTDEEKNIYYFSKSDIINSNCYRPKFVRISGGMIGQTYTREDSPYYILWLEFLNNKVKLDWVYNFKKFKDNIKLLDSFNRKDLYKGLIYFDFNDFAFKYVSTNKIRKKQKISYQYDFIGIKDDKIFLFDNQNEVARNYNLDTAAICRCLSGKYMSTRGWKFYKMSEYNKPLEDYTDCRIYAKDQYLQSQSEEGEINE